MATRKIKPSEKLKRDQQMKKFRYDAANSTGLVVSFFGNGLLVATFFIFGVMLLIGVFEGRNAVETWHNTFRLWKGLCDLFLIPLLSVVALLSLAIKLLTHDAKGKDTKIANRAIDRSIFSLLIFMSATTCLYVISVY